MMKGGANKNGQKKREEFKYKPNNCCMNCCSMQTVKRAVPGHQFEVIDKNENKRLFLKQPELYCKKKSEESSTDESLQSEEPSKKEDVVVKTESISKFDNFHLNRLRPYDQLRKDIKEDNLA